MQIKPLLLFIILAFFSLSAHQSAGQCLADSKISTDYEGNKGVIKIRFDTKSENVQVQILDMLKDSQEPLLTDKIGSVGMHREWTSIKLPASYYMILLSADGCEPKFSVHTIQLSSDGNE